MYFNSSNIKHNLHDCLCNSIDALFSGWKVCSYTSYFPYFSTHVYLQMPQYFLYLIGRSVVMVLVVPFVGNGFHIKPLSSKLKRVKLGPMPVTFIKKCTTLFMHVYPDDLRQRLYALRKKFLMVTSSSCIPEVECRL